MTAPSNHPAEIERAREARETLVELRDWIPDDDGSERSFALAEVVAPGTPARTTRSGSR